MQWMFVMCRPLTLLSSLVEKRFRQNLVDKSGDGSALGVSSRLKHFEFGICDERYDAVAPRYFFCTAWPSQ
jgi:hypothetical protein